MIIAGRSKLIPLYACCKCTPSCTLCMCLDPHQFIIQMLSELLHKVRRLENHSYVSPHSVMEIKNQNIVHLEN
jgi:predicted phosphatase